MNKNDDKYISIKNQADLDYLIERIIKGPMFANKFKFTDRNYFVSLLETLEIDYDEFIKKYYFYDKFRPLHISESEFKYVWISSYGLIPKDKSTSSKEVNACVNQYTTVSLLLDKAIEISQSDDIYDVDRYNFGILSKLSPALFHNLLFYIEVLCKAYLNLSGVTTRRTHKLTDLYSKLIDTMYIKNHNDSLFQVRIIEPLEKFIEHVKALPSDFKEEFVKYDDNANDNTIIIFESDSLNELKQILDLANDFITDYFYSGTETHYLKQGFYQKILSNAKNDEERNKINKMYGHLVSET